MWDYRVNICFRPCCFISSFSVARCNGMVVMTPLICWGCKSAMMSNYLSQDTSPRLTNSVIWPKFDTLDIQATIIGMSFESMSHTSITCTLYPLQWWPPRNLLSPLDPQVSTSSAATPPSLPRSHQSKPIPSFTKSSLPSSATLSAP